MALYEASLDVDAWKRLGENQEKVLKTVGYAAALQYSAKLAGDASASVQPSADSLRKFIGRHVASPFVDAAIHRQRYPPAILADIGGEQALYRWGRAGLSPASRLLIDGQTLADAERQPHTLGPYVLTAISPAMPVLARADVMPIGTLGSSQADAQIAAIPIPMPPSFATTTSRKRKRAGKNDAEADESEAASGSGDEEPEDGEDLDAMAADDDAEAQDEYDLDDGFIAKSDDESDKDSAEASDKEEEEEEEEEDDFTYHEPAPVVDAIIDVQKAKEDVTPLEAKNPVPEFDGKAQLYEKGKLRLANGTVIEAKHTYVVEGEIGYTSTTTLIGQFFEEFDAPKVSLGMVKSHRWQQNYEYRGPAEAWANTQMRERWQLSTYQGDVAQLPEECKTAASLFLQGSVEWPVVYGRLLVANRMLAERLNDQWQQFCADQIQQAWKHAADLGTAMHKRIEDFFEGKTLRQTLEAAAIDENEPELLQFLDWYDKVLVPGGYEPFRMELRVFRKDIGICGSVDALFRHKKTGELMMVDWKRAKKIEMEGFDGKMGKGPLADMPSCNFSKYTIQQNLYRDMLHNATKLRISSMYLLICHPRQGNKYNLLAVPEKRKELDGIYGVRRRDLNK